jgi:hypothetical protein
MSVGRVIYMDLSDADSIEFAKVSYKEMQKSINMDGDNVERYFIVGDSYKCNEENPREISFE